MAEKPGSCNREIEDSTQAMSDLLTLESTMHSAALTNGIARVTRDTFLDRYHQQFVPVIVTDVVTEWGAYKRWRPQYFAEQLRGQTVDVAVADEQVFGYDKRNTKYRIENMPFESAVDRIQSTGNERAYYYIMQKSLPEDFPSLMPDIKVPDWLEQDEISINFWMGSAGNFTPLHYDYLENFVAQISGSKRWILFSPDQLEYLYPKPLSDNFPHVSLVDVSKPDYLQFIDFKKAKAVELTLQAGEMLYLPSHWWHAVKSESVCSTINFWSYAESVDVFLATATGIRSFWMIYNKDLLQSLRELVCLDGMSYIAWADRITPQCPAAALLFAHAGIINAILSCGLDGKTAPAEQFTEHVTKLMSANIINSDDAQMLQRWRFIALETFSRSDFEAGQVSTLVTEARQFVSGIAR